MYNILITGAGGQLGKSIFDFQNAFGNYNFFLATRKDVDICDFEDVSRYCQLHQINVIINCAAYTNVDKAETNVDDAYRINEKGAENIAIIAKQLQCKLIHISTDYVFEGNGTRPYKEDDATKPVTVYGKSKLAGELAVQRINPPNTVIIRTSWLYSPYAANFLKTMLRLGKDRTEIAVVEDQKGCPTYAKDLADTMLLMLPDIMTDTVKVYHFSNQHTTSWYLFAKHIINSTYKHVKVLPITTSDFFTKAKRPAYSVLDCTLIKKDYNITIRSWKTALEDCLAGFVTGE